MIDQLIKISRYYGRRKEYVIGGGGNTSYKNDDHLWVKASGYPLADITQEGFAVLSRKLLKRISSKTYSGNPAKREQQVKNDLIAASVFPEKNLRPSVEASLHDLIDYTYVVHTHPYLVNAVTCSSQAKNTILRLFGTHALYVPYVDPGYILFKRIENDLLKYKKKYKRHPRIIFLQNHGVFVGGSTIDEIKTRYDQIFRQIKKSVKNERDKAGKTNTFKIPELLGDAIRNQNGDHAIVFKSRNNSLIRFFTYQTSNTRFITKPFIPDQIVYCRTHPLWLGSGDINQADRIEKKFKNYTNQHGILPRILLIENKGLIAMEISEKSAQLVLDVFEDAMKISYYSLNFGGPHFMTPRQIKFIEDWEVENYRRNLLVK
jgi:rhamnose utilization protein RhaD (predicted bifunctional aldolase and dehydrogenase)